MIMSYDGSWLPAGQTTLEETLEHSLTSVTWNRPHGLVSSANRQIVGTARDAGHTNYTDILRVGLLLTKNADGDFTHWGGVTSLDVDLIEGVLLVAMKMQRQGVNQNRFMGHIMLGGFIKVNGIVIPGTAAAGIVGHAREDQIRRQMHYSFVFDDDPVRHLGRPLSADEATLNDLSDVIIASPTNTQVLKYETASTSWKNAADAT
jgi:hypothetical protein